MSRLSLCFVSFSLLSSLARAVNDWSQPCLQGICSYDIPQSDSTLGGTLLISGAPHAISDITPAAGWDILNCTSDSATQTIRIICTGDGASCDHLHQNGAKDTLVRLPETCGKGPFARVSDMIMSDDQTVPSSIASKLAKREGGPAKVMTVGLDTNFSSSAHGPISFKIVGSSISGVLDSINMSPPSRKRKVDKRGDSEEMNDALNTFSDFSFGDFDKNISTNLPPISVNKDFPIFSQNISCSQVVNAGIEIDLDTKVDAQVTIGVVAQGSLVPPSVTEFAMFAALSADLVGTLNIAANAVASINTGSIPLLSLGLPGLDIEGIFSIGPTLNLNAEAKATVDVDVDLDVDLAYSVSSLKFVFPPSQGDSSADLAPKDSPLRLSVSPNVATNTTIEAHLIPSLNFGISVVGVADASIFLDLDASATLDLGIDASATGSVNTNGDKSGSADFEGCVDLKGGFSANVGAQGTFFDIFNENTQIPIISKEFELFQKCFSDSTSSSTSTKGVIAAPTSSFIKTSSSASAPTSLATKSLSSSSLIESRAPVQTRSFSATSSSFSAIATQSSSAAKLPSYADPQSSTGDSQSHKRSRGLHNRTAVTCTSPDVSLAQLLVNELLSSASFTAI